MNDGRFTFTDAKGRQWDVSLSLGIARRIENADFSAIYSEPISMIEPTEGFFHAMLGARPSLAAALIWVTVLPQAEQQLGLEQRKDESQADYHERLEEAFLEGIDGPTWSTAKKTFRESVLDFFHDQRTALLRLVEAIDRAEALKAELVEQEAATIEEEATKYVRREVGKASDELRSSLGTASGSSLQPAG